MQLHGKFLHVNDNHLRERLRPLLQDRVCSFEELESVLPGLAMAAARAIAEVELRLATDVRLLLIGDHVRAFGDHPTAGAIVSRPQPIVPAA